MCRAEPRSNRANDVQSGTRASAASAGDSGKFKNVPTIGEIRAVIPKRCFEKSLVHSFMAVGRDLMIVTVFALLASTVLDTTFPSFSNPMAIAYFVLGWCFYAFWQVGTLARITPCAA